VAKAFVTFPEYMWAKNAEKFFQISPLVFSIWWLEMDTQMERARKSYVNRGYLVSKYINTEF